MPPSPKTHAIENSEAKVEIGTQCAATSWGGLCSPLLGN